MSSQRAFPFFGHYRGKEDLLDSQEVRARRETESVERNRYHLRAFNDDMNIEYKIIIIIIMYLFVFRVLLVLMESQGPLAHPELL